MSHPFIEADRSTSKTNSCFSHISCGRGATVVIKMAYFFVGWHSNKFELFFKSGWNSKKSSMSAGDVRILKSINYWSNFWPKMASSDLERDFLGKFASKATFRNLLCLLLTNFEIWIFSFWPFLTSGAVQTKFFDIFWTP